MKRCVNCGSETTYIDKNNYEKWYRSKDKDDGFLCLKCYLRLISYPKYHPKELKKYTGITKTPDYIKNYNARRHPRRIQFKDKRLTITDNPRIGFCNICKKSIGDEYINKYGQTAKIKLTHMHHMNYHDDNPLKDSMEVCASCHANISHKEIQIIVI